MSDGRRAVPIGWALGAVVLLCGAVGWMGYRNLRLEARLEALEGPAGLAGRGDSSGRLSASTGGAGTNGAAADTARAVPAAPPPPPVSPLDTGALLESWKLIGPRVRQRCAKLAGAAQPAEIRLALWIDERGGVRKARPEGASRGPLGDCVAETTAQHQLPELGVRSQGVIALPWGAAESDRGAGEGRRRP